MSEVPTRRCAALHLAEWPFGTGEMAERIGAFDWGTSPLGSSDTWPPLLRVALATLLHLELPSCCGDRTGSCSTTMPAGPCWAQSRRRSGSRCSRSGRRSGTRPAPARRREPGACADLPLTLPREGHPEATWWTFSVSPITGDTGAVDGLLALAHETTERVGADITALKQNEKSLRQAHEAALVASRTDQLTGLPNRRYVLERSDGALAESEATGSKLSVAVIDIDHFKAINDTHGHDAGDTVLRHFASLCRERVRDQDVLGRMGGEEFLLILPGTWAGEATGIVGRIREGDPAARLAEDGFDLSYTFSAGIAEAMAGDDRSSILRRADRALYAAKGQGRNCTKIDVAAE